MGITDDDVILCDPSLSNTVPSKCTHVLHLKTKVIKGDKRLIFLFDRDTRDLQHITICIAPNTQSRACDLKNNRTHPRVFHTIEVCFFKMGTHLEGFKGS